MWEKSKNNTKNPRYNAHAACNNKLLGLCICSFNDSIIRNCPFLIQLFGLAEQTKKTTKEISETWFYLVVFLY